MARELKPGSARPGPKRQHSTTIFCNHDLDHELHRKDVLARLYEHQRIPPLKSRVPVKIRRTHTGMGVKGSPSPHKVPRSGHAPVQRTQLCTEDLHAITGELRQIKARVDSLLQSLEHIRQRGAPAAGTEDSDVKGPGSEGSSCGTTEPRGQGAAAGVHRSEGSSAEQ